MPRRPGTRGLIGRLLLFAASMLCGIAGFVYAGLLPVEHEVRARIALLLGGIAAADAALAAILILLDRP